MRAELTEKPGFILEVFDSLNISAIVIDAQHRVVMVNAAAAAIFQIAPGTMTGREVSELIPSPPFSHVWNGNEEGQSQ